MTGFQVLHATPGRIRIKAALLRNDEERAAMLLQRLRAVRGVSDVETNPVTRNVIVFYDPQQVSQLALYAQLELLFRGPVRIARHAPSPAMHADLRTHIARTLLKSAVEAAVQRAVLALI